MLGDDHPDPACASASDSWINASKSCETTGSSVAESAMIASVRTGGTATSTASEGVMR